MTEKEDPVWEGTTSELYKLTLFIIGFLVMFILLILEPIFELLFEDADAMGKLIHICITFVIVGIFSGMAIWVLIYFKNDRFPHFYVTTSKLILKKKNWRGKVRTKSLELAQIKTIYIIQGRYSDNDSFWFYTKTVREIFSDCHPELRGDLLESGFPRDCFCGWDLEFPHVNSPIALLKALEKRIPLEQHPNYPTLFEREAQAEGD